MSWDSHAPMLLAHMAEASLHRHQSGLGVRCDDWALFVFSCTWDLAGVLSYSPTRSGMSCSDQPIFPVGTYMCLHFLPRAGSVTHCSEGEELLSAVSVSSTASGDLGFTACTMWLLSIPRLSTSQWFLCVWKLLGGRLPCTSLEMATFFSTLLCTLIFQIFHVDLLKKWRVLKHERTFYFTALKIVSQHLLS